MGKPSINREFYIIPEFSTRLNESISESKFTKKQVSLMLGLDAGTVCSYTNDRIYPSLTVLRDLCKLLNVSADYLLELSDDRNIK